MGIAPTRRPMRFTPEADSGFALRFGTCQAVQIGAASGIAVRSN
jgi:hypothetical protein